jgi:glycosyltransferase involved in cell wall biosynthesis
LDALAFCSKDFGEVVITDDGSTEETLRHLKKMIGYESTKTAIQ